MPKLFRLQPKLKSSRGFTLIEILVVIGIIALLGSAIVYSTDNARQKARDSQRKASLEVIRTAAVAYYSDHGEFYDVCSDPNLHGCDSVAVPGSKFYSSNFADPNNLHNWLPGLVPYVKDGKVPVDPNQQTSSTPTFLASLPSKIASWFTSSPNTEQNQNGQVAASISIPITNGTDDGKRVPEHSAPTDFDYNITDNPVGHPFQCPGRLPTETRDSFMRFRNITVPRNATIDSATIEFTPRNDSGPGDDGANSYNPSGIKTRFRIEATDNPATITSRIDWDNRTKDATVVNWDNIEKWDPASNPSTADLTSPDIKTLIQNRVNSATWNNGNSVIIFWEDRGTDVGNYPACGGRVANSYEGQQQGYGNAPKLNITYTGGFTPTIISCESDNIGGVTGNNGLDGIISLEAEGTDPNTAASGRTVPHVLWQRAIRTEDDYSSPTGPVNVATFASKTVSIPPGNYTYWSRSRYGSDPNDNSYWMQIDKDGNGTTEGPDGTSGSYYIVGENNPGNTNFHWIKTYDQDSGATYNPATISFNLTGNDHLIKIWSRENNVSIDKIVLVNDTNYTPTGFGPTINCPAGTGGAPPPSTPTATLSSNSPITSGDTATLSWTSANAPSCSIDQGIGTVTPTTGGSVETSALTSTTTYTITCGTATASTTVTVNHVSAGVTTEDAECENACRIGIQLFGSGTGSVKNRFRIWTVLENENDPQRVVEGVPNALCNPTTDEITKMNPDDKPLYCIESPPI